MRSGRGTLRPAVARRRDVRPPNIRTCGRGLKEDVRPPARRRREAEHLAEGCSASLKDARPPSSFSLYTAPSHVPFPPPCSHGPPSLLSPLGSRSVPMARFPVFPTARPSPARARRKRLPIVMPFRRAAAPPLEEKALAPSAQRRQHGPRRAAVGASRSEARATGPIRPPRR